MAEALRDWLPNVIQAVEPWTSSSDIDAGMRWTPALSEQLQQTQLGILCLTAENLSAPWVLFEAGALSKIIDTSRVCPYLLGLEPTEVIGPLAQFQGVKAEKDGTKKLVQTINRAQGELALPEDRLNTSFNLFWPSLEKILLDISISPQETSEPKRSLEDMVEEILSIVREQSRSSSSISPVSMLGPPIQSNVLNAMNEVNDALRMRGIVVPADEIESRLRKLIVDYKVPEVEAIRSTRNYFLKLGNSKTHPEYGDAPQ